MQKNIVVTGGDGFIGTNLRIRLRELGYTDVATIGRRTSASERADLLSKADFVFHLAGVNRPPDPAEFESGNADFTRLICAELAAAGRHVPVVFTSSTQVALDNAYGRSKLAAEAALQAYQEATGAPVYILRLPNVFGKWCRPNYNSAVATFCHNTARGLPITVNDPSAPLRLIYVDDAIAAMILLTQADAEKSGNIEVGPIYETTVGEVAEIIRSFPAGRESLFVPAAGSGLVRGLYATFLSHLPPADFVYGLTLHADTRGVFAEVLKTSANGQLSFFTARPGITRGEHYHHTKSEKFVVVQGAARFQFRHIVSDSTHEVVVRAEDAQVVEVVPGWAHSVTNIGGDELVVMLWANEAFDREAPDTHAYKTAPVEAHAG